jgi:hypothetical protein
MKSIKWILSFCFLACIFTVLAFAEPSGVPVVMSSPLPAPTPDLGFREFFGQIVAEWGTIKGLGLTGWPMWSAILMAALRILISSMKVSALRAMLWDKLPASMKLMVAPVIGVMIVILTVNPINLKAILVGLTAGAGAIALHHLFRAIESLPMVSPIVKSIAGFFAKMLGGKLE